MDVERVLQTGVVMVFRRSGQSQRRQGLSRCAVDGARAARWQLRGAVQMHVRQTVTSLVTESKIVNAATWENGRLVSVAATDLPRLRDEIREMVEELLADWKAVH
jgi:hypothetical protein